MNHYNEALDYEKRALSRLVENSFYPHRETSGEAQGGCVRADGTNSAKPGAVPETSAIPDARYTAARLMQRFLRVSRIC